MAFSSYCDFNETLSSSPTAYSGLSRCIMGTIPPSLLLGIVLILTIANVWLRRKHFRLFQTNRRSTEDVENLIQHKTFVVTDNDLTLSTGDPQKSFLFTVLLCLHYLLAFLPCLYVVVIAIINTDRVQGVIMFSACSSIITWLLATWCLRTESRFYYFARYTSHSLMMLLFWAVALVAELLSFVSWNNTNWWFTLTDRVKKAELGLFVVRLTCVSCIFLLGLKAPGLFKAKKQIKEDEEGTEEQDVEAGDRVSSKTKQSTFKGFWRKSKILWPFLWPSSRLLQLRVFACFCLLVTGRVVNLLLPLVYRNIVNYFTPRPNEGTLSNPIGLILTYILLRLLQGSGPGSGGLLDNTRTFLWIKIQQFTARTLQVKLFAHLHSLSLKWHLQRKTGEVLRIIDRGNQSINSLLSYLLFNITPTMVDIVIAVVYFILAFNIWFGVIVAVTMFLYLLSTVLVTEWRTKYRRAMNEQDNKCKGKAVDSLLNFETVKYFNAEDFEVSRYNNAIVDYQSAEWWSLFSLNILNSTQNFIITIGLLIGTIYCGSLVASGHLKVGDFVLFITYMVQLYGPLNFFGTYYRMIQQAFIDMENMFDIMKVKREVADAPEAEVLAITDGKIEFKNVDFRYEPSRSILKNVTFTVLPGQTIALVGPSGGGKSTIIRLLFRFYDVVGGSVLVDGQDIRMVTQKSLREMIGVVPQDTVLFNDDIRYNIRYGRVEASDEELDDAATGADIHAKILTFPNGYKTVVGERGLKLSGGEKQRVAIARTLLKNPPVVLLDEATSALDTQTERNIQASLNNMCVNRTTLVVAHRLSTIINADQILVLVNGEIIERGRHEALLAMEGFYYDMWMQQLKSEHEKDDVEEGEASQAP